MSTVDMDERERAELGGGNGNGFADPNQYSVPAVIGAGQSSFTADTGVITAQRVAVPRDDGRVLQKLKAQAAMAGEDWYYRFPVKNRKENRTDYIEGPSIKCAMAVARTFGNCSIDCRAIDQGTTVQFLARFVDLETGFQVTRPFQQRKSQRTMGGDAERGADIVFQIGTSKAMRNAICNALETYVSFAFEAAKANLVDKVGKNLAQYREKVLYRFQELQVDLPRVERVIGKVAKDWLAPDVARLIAEIQTVQDGMASANDLWPVPGQEEAGGSKLDQFADTSGGGDTGGQQQGQQATVDAKAIGEDFLARLGRARSVKGVHNLLEEFADDLEKLPELNQELVAKANERITELEKAAPKPDQQQMQATQATQASQPQQASAQASGTAKRGGLFAKE